MVKKRILPVFDRFLPQKGPNIIRFGFWDQIWNPLVICSLYDRVLLTFSKLDFSVPHCNFKISNGACGQIFLRIRNFPCQIRNQRPKRHKNGWCSNRIAEKMVITTWPTTQELSHITERLIPSASGFRASARALLVFLLHLKAERELLPLTEQGQ